MPWKRILKRDNKFFDLLEANAVEAQSSVQLLENILNNAPVGATWEELAETRRKDKRIKEEITRQLCRTFFTPLDREDIEALSLAISKIPKMVKKFAEKYFLCRAHIHGVHFGRQTKILDQTVNTVLQMVRGLSSRTNLERMKELNDSLHALEGEADKLMLELLGELYSGSYSALQVVMVKDLYEMLEKIIDRCRDAGNVIFQVVLKSS